MKRIFTNVLIVLIITTAVIIIPWFYSSNEILPPLPYETIIVDGEDETHHIKKQEWIEEMHRTAPDDNWRYMDQMYRINNISQNRENSELPIYGKWRELGSNNQAGRTVFTYFDEVTGEMYVGADGGQIWKGSIGADDWYSINDHFRISAIRLIQKFYEEDNTRLLVHSAGWNQIGIMYSDDDGQNWSLATGLESIVSWGFIKRTVIQSNTNKSIYCLSQEWDYGAWHSISRVYKSIDHGLSFELVHTFDFGVDVVDIWTSQTYESSVFVVAQNECYYIDDSDNLISISTLPNQENGNTLLAGYDSGASIYLYAMIRFGGNSHFYASDIDGQNWDERGTNSQGPFMVNSFAASPIEKDLVYFGGMEAFSSNNAGASWVKVNSWTQYYNSPEDKLHADIPSFNSFLDDQGNEFVFVNTDGGTYISYDQLENVENLSLNNLRISQYYSSYTCRFDPSYTHAGAQDQGYQRSNEGMNEGSINYDQIISGDYGNMVSGDGGASIWMDYPGFAMYGPNINNSNSLLMEDFIGSNYQWIPKLMEDPENPENVYLAGGHITSGAHIMLLERSGNSISTTELPFDFSNGTDANISAMAFSKINHDHRYVLTSEQDFFYSTDAGNLWTQTPGFTGPGSHYFYGASIAPSNNTLGLLYVGGSGYSSPGVFRSTDNGQTFTNLSTGLPSTMVFQIVLSNDDSLLFAATEIGAFVCLTWEEQWYPLADSVVPDQAFWAVDFVDTLNLARFSTYGRGIWDFELDPDVIANFVADNIYINENETVDFTDLSEYTPISWNWYFEGGIPETSTEQNPSGIIYPNIGNYEVRLIATNDHSTDTLVKMGYISVGTVSVQEALDKINVAIYPNPANSYFFLDAKMDVDQVEIFSDMGVLCKVIGRSELSGTKTRINISDLSNGIYFVKIGSGQNSSIKKLVKQGL